MGETVTVQRNELAKIIKRLDRLEGLVKSGMYNDSFSKWMSEEEVMSITGLGKDSLRRKRQANIFGWSSATGRKIKYLRDDVEKYLDNNSSF